MGITDTLGSYWKHQYHIDSDIEPDGYWVMVDPLAGGFFYTLVVDASDTQVLQHTIKVREESPRRAAERAVAWLEREER